jgi:hypothetical protein
MNRVALVLAVALIAAACGSDEEDARQALEERGLAVDPGGFLEAVRADRTDKRSSRSENLRL